MNLIFRLLWTLFRARLRLWRGQRIGFLDEARYRFRCLPSDIDINMHLTNSRYASFMDIARIAMMVSNGAWSKFRAAQLLPVLGVSAMRFRRAIKPFQIFDVTSRTIGWDEKWFFIEHRMLVGEDLAAYAIMKAAFIGPQGRVSTADVMNIVGYTGPRDINPAMAAQFNALDASLKG